MVIRTNIAKEEDLSFLISTNVLRKSLGGGLTMQSTSRPSNNDKIYMKVTKHPKTPTVGQALTNT